MENYTETESRAIYAAAYRGLKDEQFSRYGLEICIWPDGDARPISSGCSRDAGGVAALKNVSADDFGDWDPNEITEDEFTEMCMQCFGCIEGGKEE